MWKKIISLLVGNARKNAAPVKQLRPVKEYIQLTLPLD